MPHMFYLSVYDEEDSGFCYAASANDWNAWIGSVLPDNINGQVRRYIKSNLKHIIAGLEMKAGLIIPHGEQWAGHPLLFESYFQVMTFEFCVGSFSVCEGIGSVWHVAENDAAANRRIPGVIGKTL